MNYDTTGIKNPMSLERQIVFYLMRRKRMARHILRQALRESKDPNYINWCRDIEFAAHNAAEGARRILYGIDL
jgi:hypothetical protein